jgi:hypothetical protein
MTNGRNSGVVKIILMTLLVIEIATARWAELRVSIARLVENSREPARARERGNVSAFDSAYAPFLDAVERHVPPSATVSIQAPSSDELYEYTAAYLLAPRRVVTAKMAGAWVATYASGKACSGPAFGVPNGCLEPPR